MTRSKKRLQFGLFMLTLLIGGPWMQAQNQFRVISCSGKVIHHVDKDSTYQEVIAGSKLIPAGKLILHDGCQIKLISNDKPFTIDEPGEYDLETLYSGSVSQSMSFTGKFWNFIMEGLKKSDSKKDIKEYHASFLSISGGIKGYSADSKIINISSPLPGKISMPDIPVKWNAKVSGGFTIDLLSADDRAVLERGMTLGDNYTLKKAKNNMQAGASYYIKISVGDSIASEVKVLFKELNEERIQARLESLVDYTTASEVEKKWMRAVVLEMEGYATQADSIYQDLLVTNQDNSLVKKLYILFLTRNNQMERVNALL